MNRKMIFAAAMTTFAAMASQPAAAYPLRTTGHTLASAQLASDVLDRIAVYSKATGGCSFIFSAHMRVLPRSYTSPAITARGGHAEEWTLNACAAKQRFKINMWPSPRGGTDFAVTPLTGRMPLHTR